MRTLGLFLIMIILNTLIYAQTKVSNQEISIGYGQKPKLHNCPDGSFVISFDRSPNLYFYIFDKKFNLTKEITCKKISTSPEPLFIGSTFTNNSYYFFYVNYYPNTNIVAYILDNKNEIKTEKIYEFDRNEELIDFLNIDNKIILYTNINKTNNLKILDFCDITIKENNIVLDNYECDIKNFNFKYSMPFNKQNQIKLPDKIVLINESIKDKKTIDFLLVNRKTGNYKLESIKMPISIKDSYSVSTLYNNKIYNFNYNKEKFSFNIISVDSFEIIESKQYSDNFDKILSSPVFKHNRSLSKLYQSTEKDIKDIYLEFSTPNLNMNCTYFDNEKTVLRLNKYIPPQSQYGKQTTIAHNSSFGYSYQLLLPTNSVEKCFYSVINTTDNKPVEIDNYRSIDEQIYKIEEKISEEIKFTTSFYFYINDEFYFICIDKKNKELNLYRIDKDNYWP